MKAKQYPGIKFAIIDNAYTISGLANVTSLMFAEEQIGFLAGVGLAPFHDWDSKIPADLKAQIQKAIDGIKDGSIKIDLPQRSKRSTKNRVLCSTGYSTLFCNGIQEQRCDTCFMNVP